MPKFTVLNLCLVATSLSIVSAVTEEEINILSTVVGPIIDECSAKFEGSSNGNNSTPCFVECILKKTEIFNSKGFYDPTATLTMVKTFVNNDEDFAKFEKVAKKCTKVNDQPLSDGDPKCERALLFLECAFENISQLPMLTK